MTGTERYQAPPASFAITRESAVSWFDMRQLAATAVKTLAATIVGSMSGRREIMAALDPDAGPEDLPDYRGREVMWIDYLADSGDGWNATASVAWLLGRDALALDRGLKATPQKVPPGQDEDASEIDADRWHLERGEILIAGGDQVYPTASIQTYQHRFVDPLRCARFAQTPSRTIFALPGNHDWYDGLTAFIRLFCQTGEGRRWFGAWRTAQRRSYFALPLPHGWWLWGVDTALEDDLDPPQYEYFRRQRDRLSPGDKVILCVPGPSWINKATGHPDAKEAQRLVDDKLAIIMRLARRHAGDVSVPLVLTGDKHYYTRHRGSVDGVTRDYVVCGGGGAFGLGTLHVPRCIDIGPAGGPPVLAERQPASLPDRAESIALRRRVLGFPLKNPAFSAVLAGVQLIAIWLLHTASPHPEAPFDRGWLDHSAGQRGWAGLCHMVGDVAGAALRSPGLLIATAVLLLAFGCFAASGAPPWRGRVAALVVGVAHGLLQIAGAIVLFWLVGQAMAATPITGTANHWVTLAVAGLAFFLYGGLLFGGYLLLAHKALGLHDQEVFSAQGIQDYKSFLRLRIDRKGVTVYPVGLRRVARRWRAAPGVELSAPSRTRTHGFAHAVRTPAGCQRVIDPAKKLEPHLIEEPFTVTGTPV